MAFAIKNIMIQSTVLIITTKKKKNNASSFAHLATPESIEMCRFKVMNFFTAHKPFVGYLKPKSLTVVEVKVTLIKLYPRKRYDNKCKNLMKYIEIIPQRLGGPH